MGHGDDFELPGFEEDKSSNVSSDQKAVNKIIPHSFYRDYNSGHYKDPYNNQPSSILDFYTGFEF